VLVMDQAGAVAGRGQTQTGGNVESGNCKIPFTLTDLQSATFYRLQIGGRKITLTSSEVRPPAGGQLTLRTAASDAEAWVLPPG